MKTALTIAICLLCICTCFVPSQAHAKRVLSREQSSILRIAHACNLFNAAHPELAPTAWSDLEPFVETPLDQRYPDILPTKRYAFLSQPLALHPPHRGDLIIISRQPFRAQGGYHNWLDNFRLNLSPLGRYVIYRHSDGDHFSSLYVREDYIQSLFKDHPSLLPLADTEPARPYIRHAYIGVISSWAAVLLVISFVIYDRIRRHRLRHSCASATSASTH